MERQKLYAYAAQLRHRLHRCPELSMKEYETTALICKELCNMGCEVIRWDDLTGAVGLIRGKESGPTIAVRADIDALPMEEESGSPYASQKSGRMHGCGHDGHTAVALAVGRYFAEKRDTLRGNVKLIFQPGEEVPPGGALPMIQRGVLEAPKVDAIFAFHHVGMLQEGEIGVYPCESLLGFCSFTLSFQVKGEDPVMNVNPALCRFSEEIHRRIPFTRPAMVIYKTIGNGSYVGGQEGEAIVEGSCKTFYPQTMKEFPHLLEEAMEAVTGEMKIEGRVAAFFVGYPPVYNDVDASWIVKTAAETCVGTEQVKLTRGPLVAADDMAYFTERVPGCYFWAGITPEGSPEIRAHQPRFDFNDRAMYPVIDTMIASVERALQYYGKERQE